MGELDTPITDLNKSLFDAHFALSPDLDTENSQQQLERRFVVPGVSHVVGDKRQKLFRYSSLKRLINFLILMP